MHWHSLALQKEMNNISCTVAYHSDEKWIATCWFKSEVPTGPFGYSNRAQLLENLYVDVDAMQSKGSNGVLRFQTFIEGFRGPGSFCRE